MLRIKEYMASVLDAFSQLVNTLFLFSFNANQSLCGRLYENRRKGAWGIAMRIVDLACSTLGGEQHCKKAYEKDLSRAAKYLQNHKNIK